MWPGQYGAGLNAEFMTVSSFSKTKPILRALFVLLISAQF
jgi:hypothetical protein